MTLDEIIGKYPDWHRIIRKSDNSIQSLVNCGIPISIAEDRLREHLKDPTQTSDWIKEQLEATDWKVIE